MKEYFPTGIFQNPAGIFFLCGNFENSHGNINLGWLFLHHVEIYISESMSVAISLIYKQNIPRMVPWGTPDKTGLLPNRSAPFMNNVVSAEGVTKLLKGLILSKALGPDKLHPKCPKRTCLQIRSSVCSPVPTIYRHEWNPKGMANICPLFKKRDRSLVACNYHPVSLICVPCKLLEHIIWSNIMAHLDEHKILSDRQRAFRKRHSCETQLINWAKILDKSR